MSRNNMTKENAWSIEDIASYYAKYAKTYDSEIKPETYPAPFLISSWVAEALCNSFEGPLSILDVGVGTGQRYRNRLDTFGLLNNLRTGK